MRSGRESVGGGIHRSIHRCTGRAIAIWLAKRATVLWLIAVCGHTHTHTHGSGERGGETQAKSISTSLHVPLFGYTTKPTTNTAAADDPSLTPINSFDTRGSCRRRSTRDGRATGVRQEQSLRGRNEPTHTQAAPLRAANLVYQNRNGIEIFRPLRFWSNPEAGPSQRR